MWMLRMRRKRNISASGTGEYDRDTSLAISAMLVAKLRAQGCSVDYHVPWGVPHAGDYDLDELFAWIDEICRR